MFEMLLLVFLIGAYYALDGRRFLALERIAEPVFAVNLLYLLNFPVRALVLLIFEGTIETAPALVWDFATGNAVLLYATACVLVFNFSYQHFTGGRLFPALPAIHELPPLQPIPIPVWGYFALVATVVVYFLLTSRTSINWIHDLGPSDIPTAVHASWFALDAAISGSLIMALITRRPLYMAAFLFFLGALLYHSFLLTAKYALFGYLAVVLLTLKRAGAAIRPWHIVVALLVAVPYIISSYAVRELDPAAISPEETLVARVSLIATLLERSTVGDVLKDLFLLKISGRFAYQETFMVYLQGLDQGVLPDLYDQFGSLPTYKRAIPSIFGVDKSTVENIHVWFANKYWYGAPPDTWAVVVPFGRVTESFMIFGWAGFLFFACYAWLFAWVYRRFYCSPDPLMVTYYLIIFYYYVLVDDNLLSNFSGIVWGSVFFFGSLWAVRLVVKRRGAEAAQPAARLGA